MKPLQRVELARAWSLGLVALAGILIGLGFAPMEIWPAPLAGVALLTWVVAGRRFWGVFGHGFVAGVALNALTIQWIGVLGVPVAIGLIAFMALWTALVAGAAAVLTRIRGWALWVPCAWVAVELLSARIPFGGFPWNRLAYTTVDQPLSGWLPWLGAVGVSFLVALVAHLLLAVVLQRRARLVGAVGVVSLFTVGALLPLVPHARPEQQITVGMVQGNVNRIEKGTTSYARSVTNNHLSETIFLLAENRATDQLKLDFLLWPENATDVDPIMDAQTRDIVEASARLASVPILVGAVMQGPNPAEERQTSGIWWDPAAGPVSRYDKRNLVPFGEWIPFRDFLLPRMPILKQIGRQSVPGTEPGVLSAPTEAFQHLRIGDVICFELAWDDTVYDTVRHGADVIVSQSNTNTYGDTFEVPQQLVINRVRAMELGREVIASTLNSTSALVGVDGSVHGITDEFTAAHRTFTVPLRSNVNLAVLLNPWLGLLLSAIAVAALVTAVAAGGDRKPSARLEQQADRAIGRQE